VLEEDFVRGSFPRAGDGVFVLEEDFVRGSFPRAGDFDFETTLSALGLESSPGELADCARFSDLFFRCV